MKISRVNLIRNNNNINKKFRIIIYLYFFILIKNKGSVDKTLKITDMRCGKKNKSEIVINAHTSDVNVLSWCKINDRIIATGSDDCGIKVWDLKYPQNPQSEIFFHKEPITSI